MQLMNQNNNQNLISKVNELSKELKQSGKNPQQMVMDMLQSGKISQSDFENAKRFAESNLKIFK